MSLRMEKSPDIICQKCEMCERGKKKKKKTLELLEVKQSWKEEGEGRADEERR